MAAKKSPIVYKRDRNKVEISGDANDIRNMIWFDLITSRFAWLWSLLLFIKAPLTQLPSIFGWLKRKIPFLTLLPGMVVFLLLLSG